MSWARITGTTSRFAGMVGVIEKAATESDQRTVIFITGRERGWFTPGTWEPWPGQELTGPQASLLNDAVRVPGMVVTSPREKKMAAALEAKHAVMLVRLGTGHGVEVYPLDDVQDDPDDPQYEVIMPEPEITIPHVLSALDVYRDAIRRTRDAEHAYDTPLRERQGAIENDARKALLSIIQPKAAK